MIRRLDLRSGLPANLGAVVPRAQMDVEHAMDVVRAIVSDVAKRGAPAVLDHGERLDGVRPEHLRVPAARIAEAVERLDPDVRASLQVTIDRVRAVHADHVPTDRVTEVAPGGTVTQRWIPVDRVGLYVPGGRAVYPSSVVMNVVPAQIAGVGSLAVASPPQLDNDGLPHPTILAACAMLGVEEVYAAGGAQAIALFAYGAPLEDGTVCRPVDLVTGPGNIWVTAAKRLLKGRIGIDSEAGPTEIAILADETADPLLVAADLVSQAEHDVIAASVLVTNSPRLASGVESALGQQVAAAKHSLRIREALAGMQSAIILVDSIRDGLAVVNAYAAEHLEIHTRNPEKVAGKVRNAGAVFLGPWSPVSLGDYAAGSNHVLPTGGCACHSSGLGVASFLRSISFVAYDEAALAEVAPHVVTLAQAEDLPGHAAAITARFER